jgi:hypothetical protein
MSLTRLPGWQGALDCFLTAHRDSCFQYGIWDCCLFACDAIEVMTGVDVAAQFRDRYHTRAEALRAIREYTGKVSVRAAAERVTAAYEMPRVEILRAQRGDVVLVRRSRDYSLGIVALNGTDVITVTPHGLQRIALSNAVFGWRV